MFEAGNMLAAPAPLGRIVAQAARDRPSKRRGRVRVSIAALQVSVPACRCGRTRLGSPPGRGSETPAWRARRPRRPGPDRLPPVRGPGRASRPHRSARPGESRSIRRSQAASASSAARARSSSGLIVSRSGAGLRRRTIGRPSAGEAVGDAVTVVRPRAERMRGHGSRQASAW